MWSRACRCWPRRAAPDAGGRARRSRRHTGSRPSAGPAAAARPAVRPACDKRVNAPRKFVTERIDVCGVVVNIAWSLFGSSARAHAEEHVQRTCHARDRARAALRLGRRARERSERRPRCLLGGELLLDQPLDARDQGREPCFSTRSERRVCARRGVELSGRICWCDGRRLRLESYRGFVQLAHRRRKRAHPRAARRARPRRGECASRRVR